MKQFYLQKNPGQLLNLLGKLYVFAYTWSLGGNYRRQEDVDEDDMGSRRGGTEKREPEINICNEFDNFMREMFEVEPPLGETPLVEDQFSFIKTQCLTTFVGAAVLEPNKESIILSLNSLNLTKSIISEPHFLSKKSKHLTI